MRWENRCPAVIYAEVNGRQQVIDRCAYEAADEHSHWSKNHGERDPWVIPVYNPYVASSLMGYWPFLIPKRKPEVGYWPRSRSTSAPSTDFYMPRWKASFEGVREAQENYAYHRHQQWMTDQFRAKLHFANRIVMP